MKLSLVTVCHRSSAHLAACLASFRAEASRLGAAAEVVVVEQSEDAAEATAVRTLSPDLCLERPNRGYAAGLNQGAAAATGDVLLLANPDVELLPGALSALLEPLQDGPTVTGPHLVWDRSGRLLLPPPDDPGPAAELGRALECRFQTCWRRGLPGRLEQADRLFRSREPVDVPCLRGPLLALTRATWERLGPLDEGYFLYFEETEWLWRARRRGARLLLATGARVVHRFGHATAHRGDRAAVEQRSRQRFLARNHPWPARLALRLVEAAPARAGLAAVPVASAREVPRLDADLWLLSPFAHLQPAGGWPAELPPEELAELTASGRWYLAAAGRRDGRWRLLGGWTWGAP